MHRGLESCVALAKLTGLQAEVSGLTDDSSKTLWREFRNADDIINFSRSGAHLDKASRRVLDGRQRPVDGISCGNLAA